MFQECIQNNHKLHGWKELSTITGKPESTLYKWGAGLASPPVPTMTKVLRALRLDPQMLMMNPSEFHRLWKLKFLSYTALQDRYKEAGSDPFESSFLVNLTAVILLRDLSVRGHALSLLTTEVGQPEFSPIYENQVFQGLKLKLTAKPGVGILMHVTSTMGIESSPVLVSLDNLDRVLDSVRKTKDKTV